jgi:hypothetical protein
MKPGATALTWRLCHLRLVAGRQGAALDAAAASAEAAPGDLDAAVLHAALLQARTVTDIGRTSSQFASYRTSSLRPR